MEKLKYAQDLIKTSNSSIACGFNMFINGESEPKCTDGYHDFYARSEGWLYAKELAKEGKINLTGINDQFDIPSNVNLVIDGNDNIYDNINKILKL